MTTDAKPVHRGQRKSEMLYLNELRKMHKPEYYEVTGEEVFDEKKMAKRDTNGMDFDSMREEKMAILEMEMEEGRLVIPDPILKPMPKHIEDDDLLAPLGGSGGKRGGKKAKKSSPKHLRPRSMTERVANLLNHAHNTGDVLDLTKHHSKDTGEAETVDAAREVAAEGEWEGLTTWDGRKKIINIEYPYLALSEKQETMSMRQAENFQVRAEERAAAGSEATRGRGVVSYGTGVALTPAASHPNLPPHPLSFPCRSVLPSMFEFIKA